jgi:ferredoxin
MQPRIDPTSTTDAAGDGNTMKLQIDADACTGHGRCYVLAPEVFEPDDEGHSLGLVDEIPDDLLDKARLAAANCPESAITIVDD